MRFDDEGNRKIRSRDLAIDLDVLRSFVEVAALGNLTRAAEKLGRAQSTISTHISKMEIVYSGKLFDRTPQGVALTERGIVVRTAAERMLDVQAQTLATLHKTSLAGTLRVGIMDDYALERFPRVLKRFATRNPDLALRVEVALSAQLHAGIEKGRLDLAVVRRRAHSSEGKTLAKEKLQWVAAPGTTLPENAPVPLVLFDTACLYRGAIIDALQQHKTGFLISATGSSLAGVVASCLAGLGITALSESTIPDFLAPLSSERLPILGGTEIAVVTAQGAPIAAKELEHDLLREHFAQNID